jgi:hypothetical protein
MPELTDQFPELAHYDRIIVEVVDHGAYFSLIAYLENGIENEVYVENSELEFIDDGIGYESV